MLKIAGVRRSSLDVVADILLALRRERGRLKPTHVMYKANLSHKLLKGYLDDLLSKELIVEVDAEKGRKYIQLTEKGLDFLQQFEKLKEFRETFGI